jgi:hypothetical protein
LTSFFELSIGIRSIFPSSKRSSLPKNDERCAPPFTEDDLLWMLVLLDFDVPSSSILFTVLKMSTTTSTYKHHQVLSFRQGKLPVEESLGFQHDPYALPDLYKYRRRTRQARDGIRTINLAEKTISSTVSMMISLELMTRDCHSRHLLFGLIVHRRNILLLITVTIALLTGAALYDRVSTRQSLQWGLDLVAQSNDLDPQAWLGPNARGRFGLKGKAAEDMMRSGEQDVEQEDALGDDIEDDSGSPLIIEAEQIEPAAIELATKMDEDEVPEQAGLPRRANANRAVSEIPVEERWSLVKGLRRLAERMPRRYPAE